jgi:dihydropteroate synthase
VTSSPQPWLIHGIPHAVRPRALVMGIVNVTPDSFSDGGHFLDAGRAVEHGLRLLAEGADILDIGGESTRPGAEPVSAEEEIRRVIPVIKGIRSQTSALLSIDTMKAAVARAALAAGADIINDVTGFGGDPGMIQLASETDAGLVVMHMRGTPASMQTAPTYTDVVAEVRAYFERRLHVLTDAGIAPERIVFDPGFGFGKTLEHNLQLLRRLPELRLADRPLLVGISRKSMLSRLSGLDDVSDRYWPTVALTAWLREQGADIHRVHDVAPNTQSLRMIEAITASG